MPTYKPPKLTSSTKVDGHQIALSLVRNDDNVHKFQQALTVALQTDQEYQTACQSDDHDTQLTRLETHMTRIAEILWPKRAAPKHCDPTIEELGRTKQEQ